MKKVAVLLTCHNRKNKTLSCLNHLLQAELPVDYEIMVFLVDDGSSDGTGEAVKLNYPDVCVIQGTGNLFWNQGMRLAWQTAISNSGYDYYIWLNDDTILDKDAIQELFACNRRAILENGKSAIITGACRNTENSEDFSYGGRTEAGAVLPNNELQEVLYVNGNIVLIPSEIYETIGTLSNDYTHGIGDHDYGLLAQLKGYKCYTTTKYIAVCPQNEGIPTWSNPNVPLLKRWKAFHSPLGLNINEYLTFRRKFFKKQWLNYALKAYMKVLVPNLYVKLKK
jgi:GT2 family glycosyltransferase